MVDIESEIRQWRELNKRNSEEGPHGFLNNFGNILPNAIYLEGSRYRMLAKRLGYWDKTYGQTMYKDTPEENRHLYSDLYLKQTPREFYAIVDETVEKCGFSREELGRIQASWKDDSLNIKVQEQNSFLDRVFPIYVALRNKGYSHYDLTG